MADNSNIILKWTIENVSGLAGRKSESTVLRAGGLEWKADFFTRTSDHIVYFAITCENPQGGNWNCDCKIDFEISSSLFARKKSEHFSETQPRAIFGTAMLWSEFANVDEGYIKDDNVFVEFRIAILSSDGIDASEPAPIFDLTSLCSPNEANNVYLVIGDKKVQVSKDYLAMHSPVFSTMLYGNFEENGKEEVEIKEVMYEQFVDLLQVISPGRAKINDSTVLHVLALGDRFHMERVLDLAETHLLTSANFTALEKLKLADQYRLRSLRDSVLQSYKSARALKAIKPSPEFASFSDNTLAAICRRLMTLD